ncbi:VOC family protein [Candidatus Bipolaricaulota bacterium]|nr:VOC family protein [Candidatus Bipolaricaulota bacterium]
MITGIDVVYVHGRGKSDRLKTWYAEILGLGASMNSGHWHEYALADGSRFALDIPGPIRSEVEQQPVLVSFRVEDIHAAVETLIGRGVVFHRSKQPIVDVGQAWVATFQDPDGTWLQISQRKSVTPAS